MGVGDMAMDAGAVGCVGDVGYGGGVGGHASAVGGSNPSFIKYFLSYYYYYYDITIPVIIGFG